MLPSKLGGHLRIFQTYVVEVSMKVTSLEIRLLEIPFPEEFLDASSLFTDEPERSFSSYLVKVFTDEGITGIGAQNVYNPNMTAGWEKYVKSSVEPFLVNGIVDPLLIEKFSRAINLQPPATYSTPRPCSVEMALWDILGKKAGLPLFKILGATKDKVKAYASVLEPYPLLTPQGWVDFIKSVCDADFKAVKLHIGARWGKEGPKNTLAVVEAIRNELGDDLDIMIDAMKAWPTSHPYDYNTALELARGLEKYNVVFLEEPLPHIHNPELASRLCSSVDIEIAGGGAMAGWQSFKTVLEKGALDIVEPDVQYAGGISELKKIAFLAEVHGRCCIPHFWGPGLALAATLQVIGSIDSPYVEYNFHPPIWVPEVRDITLKNPITVDKEGYVKIPDGPGLGVELNEENVERYTVTKL
ncbi:D-galactarolactone cycloisomerase [subsurface metagenome]